LPSLSGAAVAHTHATQVVSASHASQHVDCDASARAGLSAIMRGEVASWPAIGAAHDGVGAAICSVSTSESLVSRAYVAFGWSTLLNGRVVGGRFATRNVLRSSKPLAPLRSTRSNDGASDWTRYDSPPRVSVGSSSGALNESETSDSANIGDMIVGRSDYASGALNERSASTSANIVVGRSDLVR